MSKPDALSARVVVSGEVLAQEIDGEMVLLDLKSESYFGLDPVATRIWQLLQSHGDLQQVQAIMADEFEVDGDQLTRDLRDHINELLAAGLVHLQDEEA